MKIKDISAVLLGHRKTDPPMQRSYALVRVETESGLIGYGEASSNYGHSYPTVIKTIVDDVVAPNLIGEDALDSRARVAQMKVLLDGYLGWDGVSSQVIGAVEIALWDILGKELGQPICRLLGAAPRKLALYGTGTTMFEASPQWYARYFDDALSTGIRAVKVRLGTEQRPSVERVAGVREYVGQDVAIMVDAYWGFAPDDALTLTRSLEPFDITFFEEPSPQYQCAGFRRLCMHSKIPIAVGERVYTPSHYNLLAQMGLAHVFEPDASLSGGISACMEIASIARANDIRVVPHTGSPTAVGLAANLHWATAAGCDLFEFDIDPALPVRDGIVRDAIFDLTRITDGTLTAPAGPGLGIEVDESAFERFPYVAGETYAEVFKDHEARRG